MLATVWMPEWANPGHAPWAFTTRPQQPSVTKHFGEPLGLSDSPARIAGPGHNPSYTVYRRAVIVCRRRLRCPLVAR